MVKQRQLSREEGQVGTIANKKDEQNEESDESEEKVVPRRWLP
jgi:hypothetical protein